MMKMKGRRSCNRNSQDEPQLSPPLSELSSRAKSICVTAVLKKARRTFVHSQGWCTAEIVTAYGLNKTGVFRSIVTVAKDEILKARGVDSTESFAEQNKNGSRVYTL
eukprot:IDg17946t1